MLSQGLRDERQAILFCAVDQNWKIIDLLALRAMKVNLKLLLTF